MDRFFNNPLKRSSDLTSVEKKQKTDVSQTNDEQSTDVSRNMESLLNSSSIEFHRNIATKISEQIKEDKHECCSLISKYGIDSNELLHLLGEWTQDLIMKYKQNREQLKGLLQEKWERGELPNIKSDDDSNRLVYEHIRNLNEWQRTGLANIKQQFSEVPTTEHVRDKTNRLIKELLKTMSSIIFVQQNLTNCNSDDRSRIDTSLHSLRTTEEQIKRMQKLNEKEYNTICIIGLEKAGKSSFINALLGFEILPFKIERCTQIQTIVKPILKEDPKLFATIEFYNRDEYLLLMEQLPKNNNETNVAFDKRQKLIDQKREESIPSDTLREDYRVSGESERRKVIKKLHMYITDDTYLSIVRHVVFYTDKLPGENYILVDVPGCDSPIAEHRASAIKAVKNADAFLFLTDGQRPSLTDHQIRLLNEIQFGHFDGMKRAFGIITKLDLCPTQVKYQEHLVKARCELEQKGFRSDHIFTVASNVVLLEETKSNPKELNQSKARLNHYGSLLDGFHQCKQKLNNFIECELPRSRFGQIVTIAEEKISHNVENTLKLCQQSILMGIDEISLDEYIKRLHRNEWNEIFENKCYQPVLARAVRWQKETLILKKTECIEALTACFHEQLRNIQKRCQQILRTDKRRYADDVDYN